MLIHAFFYRFQDRFEFHKGWHPGHPWLDGIAYAAERLGLNKRHLEAEVMAYAPSKRRQYLYWSGGIDFTISNALWTTLARRLAPDKALVNVAFLHEPHIAAALMSTIAELESKYFDLIKVNREGDFLGHICKGEMSDDSASEKGVLARHDSTSDDSELS